MTVRTVCTFIENETAYIEKHMRPALQIEEAAGRLIVDPKKIDGTVRRKGSYPPEARLKWR